jgi:hypothetical protein
MKKLNQKGFSHHLMIVGAAVLVVAAVGFAGWRVYQGRSVEANAAGFGSSIGSDRGVAFYACKSTVTKGGHSIRITAQVKSAEGTNSMFKSDKYLHINAKSDNSTFSTVAKNTNRKWSKASYSVGAYIQTSVLVGSGQVAITWISDSKGWPFLNPPTNDKPGVPRKIRPGDIKSC